MPMPESQSGLEKQLRYLRILIMNYGKVLHLVEPRDEMRQGNLFQHALQRVVVDRALFAWIAHDGTKVAEGGRRRQFSER